MATDEEGYSSYSDMEPDPGPGYLGSSPAVKLNSRHPPRNGKNGAHHGKNGATGAVAAAAAATAALPDIGAMLKSISQVRYNRRFCSPCVWIFVLTPS